MKIRSQIIGLLLMAALIVPLSAGVALYLARDVEARIDDILATENLGHSASQLAQVAVETALFHEARSQDQWHRKIASINDELGSIRVTNPGDKEGVERIRKNIDLMQVIFPRLVREPGANTGAVGQPLSEVRSAMESRSVASLLVVSQEITVIGAELIRGNRDEAEVAFRRLRLAIGLIMLMISALAVFAWKVVSRGVLRPLQDFEQGTREVAAGNYAYRLNLAQRDEIGELAAAFDAMAERVEKSAAGLEEHRANLAALVLSRTTDLSTARDIAEGLSEYARSLIEASLDPLVTISADGKITDVNEASVQATGVPRSQLVGTDFSDYFTDPDEARAGYRKVFSDGLVRDYPLAVRHASGRIIDVLYNASVYKDGGGNVLGVFAAARDVTERKRIDQTLQETILELKGATFAADKANLAKSEFLSSMSHELRSPLNAILGFAQLLESDSQIPTPSQKESIDTILQAGWYLLELINEILDLALIESGKLSLSPEPISLAEVFSDCLAMIEIQAQTAGIRVSLSDFAHPYIVSGDMTRLKQVVVNLLSNAIKYNRVGGMVEVTCDASAGPRTRVSIRDTGQGLSAEQLAELFQPFNRLGQEGGGVQGTGIGLVVCKRLVELMGGEIGAQSTVGVGSVFWFELNTTAETRLSDDAAAPIAAITAENRAAARLRTLLYVEDNPANLKLVQKLLARRPDIYLLSTSDGHRGIEIARAELPDAILMDINLPGISGIEAKKVLADDPTTARIPVIALSANAMPSDIERGIEAGFIAYLTKPIKIKEFMDTLDAVLESAHAESAGSGGEEEV